MIYNNGYEEKPDNIVQKVLWFMILIFVFVYQFASIVTLNLGGHFYTTRLSTLCRYPDSMLATMFSGRHNIDQDSNGNYFLDNNGIYFSYLLDYLRNETLPPKEMAALVYKEAGYYGISNLQEALSNSPEVRILILLLSLFDSQILFKYNIS